MYVLNSGSNNREHTILLNMERVNKERIEWIFYLCLLLSSLTRPYRENRYLRNTVVLNSYLGLFALCKKKTIFRLHIIMTREAFRCFHETKPTQKEVGRFFYNLAEFFFEYFLRQSENFSVFCKVFSQIAFRNMIVPLIPNASSCARSSSPPSLTDASTKQLSLLTQRKLQNST